VFGLKTLGGDAWAVATGPTHMDRSDFLWTIGVFGVAGTLYHYDLEILNGMHRSWDAPVYGPIVKFGSQLEKLGYIGALAPYYAGGFAVTYVLRLDPFPQMFAEAAESNLITGVVRNALEMTLRRQRPREGYDPRAWFVKGGDSFPSGHASVVFELATIASQHTRSNTLRVLYYAVAGSISVARAQDDAHWPSDVFVGAVIGTVVSRAIVRRH
jgi:membrane-associated phospholipid phosphatase